LLDVNGTDPDCRRQQGDEDVDDDDDDEGF
jgi:hypothetical protein